MPTRDFALLAAICLVWAGNNIVSKIIITHFGAPPLFYATARFALVTLLTLPWLLPAPRPLGRLVLIALLMGAAPFGLVFMGLQTTAPSSVAIVAQLGLPISIALSAVLLGEHIPARRALGMILTLAGVVVVMWDPAGFRLGPGLLFVVGSAATGALGAVLMKGTEGVRPLTFQAWVGLAGVAPLALLSGTFEHGQATVLTRAPWEFCAAVAFSGIVVSVIAHTAYFGLIQRYEVNLLQPLMLMTPLANIALGVMITHDHFDFRMAVGSAVALAGVLIIALPMGQAGGFRRLIRGLVA
jgi:drug/metabolite transporter (DMT)-like permease